MGAPYHPDTASHGHVRVYQYENTNNTWNQLGIDIEGSNQNDQFGYAVSLSGDGATIAIIFMIQFMFTNKMVIER